MGARRADSRRRADRAVSRLRPLAAAPQRFAGPVRLGGRCGKNRRLGPPIEGRHMAENLWLQHGPESMYCLDIKKPAVTLVLGNDGQ